MLLEKVEVQITGSISYDVTTLNYDVTSLSIIIDPRFIFMK